MNKIIGDYKQKQENIRSIKLISYALFFGAGTYGIKAIMYGFGLYDYGIEASFLIYLIWFALMFNLFRVNIDIFYDILKIEIVFLVFLGLNYFFFPFTREYYDEYIMFLRQIIVVYVPSGVIAYNTKSFKDFFKYSRGISWIGSIFLFVALLFGYMEVYDYQYWGVHLSPFLLIAYGSFLLYNKKIDLALTLFDLSLILLGGRQSFFVAVIGMLLMYIVVKCKDKRHKLLMYILFVSIFFLAYLLSDILIDGLGGLVSLLGINSRTLDMLVSGEIFSTTTRAYIYDSSIRALVNHGDNINGIFADRYFVRRYGDWIAYPHNIFFELLLDFGYVVGSVFSFLLIIIVIMNFIKGSIERKTLVSMLFSIVFLRLFVSSSFIIEGTFYLMLGLFFGVKFTGKNNDC